MNPIHSGRVIAGKYRLEDCRARGGMGSVWAARHLALDTQLAIKFIEPQFTASSEARGRFEREAKAAAMVGGVNVAQIHDYGIEDGIPYIAMELLVGEDLSARLAREKRIPLPTAAHVVHQVAKVLRRAHEVGIIHRDLKPGNVFLIEGDDEEPIVKVLDFGVAKAVNLETFGDPTKSGTLVGSPRYMSPEQARGVKAIDYRSDLWSLGVIAFRMVTGELPFPGNEIGDLIVRICTEQPPTPSTVAPDLPPAIDRFFERALARDPDDRFPSARAMAQAFALAAGLSPPPSSAGYSVLQDAEARAAPELTPVTSRFALRAPVPDAGLERTLHSFTAEEASEIPLRDDDTALKPSCPTIEPGAALALKRRILLAGHRWGAACTLAIGLVLAGLLMAFRMVPASSEPIAPAKPSTRAALGADPPQAALRAPSRGTQPAESSAPPQSELAPRSAPSARRPPAGPRTPRRTSAPGT